MKKFFFAIFSVTFFFFMFISGKKIKENKQLNLNEKYRVIKYQGFTFDEQVEHLIIGPEYNIIFYEEKSIWWGGTPTFVTFLKMTDSYLFYPQILLFFNIILSYFIIFVN